ncbi:MAG: ABC transporter permease [[Clostridium] scindens]
MGRRKGIAVILRLTWRYMKQNRRRTIITTLGIALAVCALTAVVVFTSSFTRISREMVIKDEGGWHVRFHQVTEAQAKELAEWKKAKKSSPAKDCGEHAGELCMDVEMRRPGIGTLAAAQKYAKEIGMEELPKGSGANYPTIRQRSMK